VVAAWCAVLSFGFTAAPVLGQDAKELSRARATFQQAVELEQAGNWSSAVQLFREVGQVRMTPQVRFHIALCEDKLGRLVEALGGYELALADADTVGPDFRAEVEANVNRLKQRIPKLTLQRGAGAEAASIELDSVAVGDSSVGVELPVNPGPHAIVAKAPNFLPFETTVTLSEGDTKSVEIVLEPAPAAAQPLGDGTGASRAEAPPKTNWVPYIVGGAGAATLLTSGVLFALRQSTLSNLEHNCPNDVCPTSYRDDFKRFKTYHYATIVTFSTGLAAVGTAAVLFVLDARKGKPQTSEVMLAPIVSRDTAGASALLRF
jgi:hypothetical protein